MVELLKQIIAGEDLTAEQATRAMTAIMSGQAGEIQTAGFLTALALKGETGVEIEAFSRAMRKAAVSWPRRVGDTLLDTCGTGGDSSGIINISTLSALVVASLGVKVAKHGNVGVSSSCGSSDVLSHLGAKFTAESGVLEKQLDQANICYLHAPLFHPAMKNVAPIRKALGVRTFFNLLGPLVSPVRPKYQVIGVFSSEIARLFHYLLTQSESEYIVIHSLDGYDEVSCTGEWREFSRVRNHIVSPEQFGIDRVRPEELRGGDSVEDGAEIFLRVLNGEGSEAQNQVVQVNAAYGISLVNKEMSFEDALLAAKESLVSGKAHKSFKGFIELSQEAA